MGDSPRRSRYDSRGDSPPPPRDSRRSPPPRRPRDDDRGPNEDNANPGNNLYVTGLSMRVTEDELLKHFEREGKVLECRLVVDPRTKESRGFAFVTMAEVDDAEACIKYLNKSTLEGRVISVERPIAENSPSFLAMHATCAPTIKCFASLESASLCARLNASRVKSSQVSSLYQAVKWDLNSSSST
eukprot:TRINITY_DN210_c0_g1_i4.p1 TRINITY_DN210_c0_g1~~TRINITY_DN210_c0_g1_i4.p1  ORF type:complete len:186 (+),score=32.77 TRINITY_DN210_c0_g1_i4:121-678(+)